MLVIGSKSHLDHDVPWSVLMHLLGLFAEKNGFFTATVDLKSKGYDFPCSLIGPITRFDIVTEDQVFYKNRGDRTYQSRCVPINKYGVKKTSLLTVIAGPYEDIPCMLYTAFPGPSAPKEVNDPSMNEKERFFAEQFWKEHALAVDV